MKIIKMDDLAKSFDNLEIEKIGEPNNDEKQLVECVNILVNEAEFEREYSFKLQEHIKECGEFVTFLRDKVKHIKVVTEGQVGCKMFLNPKSTI